MSLFQLEKITLHSGKTSQFKIECDKLTKEDWECLAYLGSRIVGPFLQAVGVPTGGLPFERVMKKYKDRGRVLIVDDVLTTGDSILRLMKWWPGSIGLVAFARGPCPPDVKAIFQMNPDAEDAE